MALLGALGLSACGDETTTTSTTTTPQQTTITTTTTTTTTKPNPLRDTGLEQILGKANLHLVDMLVQQYGNQPEKVRTAAERFRQDNWNVAVALYQGIGDTDTATAILREKFRGNDCKSVDWSYVTVCEALGFQPTADDQLQRFISGMYISDNPSNPSKGTALNACRESTDNDLKRGLAGRLEHTTNRDVAITCFRSAGDEESATRIAHSYFVVGSEDYLRDVERQLKDWGFASVPREWYIERGDHLRAARGGDTEHPLQLAFEAYHAVGHQEGMQTVLERAEQQKYFMLASLFAKDLGLADRAKELARRGFQESTEINPVFLRQALESYGLQAEAPAILQERGNDHFQRGNYASALGFFEAANDPQGVQRTLDRLTTPTVE